jgi:hypothetical protein
LRVQRAEQARVLAHADTAEAEADGLKEEGLSAEAEVVRLLVQRWRARAKQV